MEEKSGGDRRRRRRRPIIRKPQSSLEDVPEELMQLILSCLTPKEAARTSILSKSWLYAWSTIPTLRFTEQCGANEVDRTLQRYLRDNIPFETIDVVIPINDQVSLAENWIRPVATRTCVKELSLTVNVEVPYTLPGEIFSSKNIRKISIRHFNTYLCIGSCSPMIECVSLRVLELINVHISEEVVDKLLSTCRLLEEVKLSWCKEGLKTIKVKNLPYLSKLTIETSGKDELEIYDVPNLSCFNHYSFRQRYFPSFTIDSIARVTELSLQGVIKLEL